jgi:hypothetical protein
MPHIRDSYAAVRDEEFEVIAVPPPRKGTGVFVLTFADGIGSSPIEVHGLVDLVSAGSPTFA